MITDNTAGIIDMESADLNGDNRPDLVTITSGRTDGDRVSWWPNSQWEKGVGSLSCDFAVSRRKKRRPISLVDLLIDRVRELLRQHPEAGG